MAAVAANIFKETGPPLHLTNKMSQEGANERVLYGAQSLLFLQKGVTAVTSIFGISIPLTHLMDVMAKEITEVPHPLQESFVSGVGILADFKK